MWFKQDCWDSDDKAVSLKNSKTDVKMPEVFSATVAINLVYRRLPTETSLSAYTSKVKCKTYEEFIKSKDSACNEIKAAGELLKNSDDDDVVTLFDSLVIKKSQFVSLNLDTSVNQS